LWSKPYVTYVIKLITRIAIVNFENQGYRKLFNVVQYSTIWETFKVEGAPSQPLKWWMSINFDWNRNILSQSLNLSTGSGLGPCGRVQLPEVPMSYPLTPGPRWRQFLLLESDKPQKVVHISLLRMVKITVLWVAQKISTWLDEKIHPDLQRRNYLRLIPYNQ